MKQYRLASAVGKRKTRKEENLIYDLIDSKTVLPVYNVTDPRVSLSLTKDLDSYKLYVADTAKNTGDCIVISQKDLEKEEEIRYLPVYLTPFLCR